MISKLSRRGLLGLLAGAAAAPLLPEAAETAAVTGQMTLYPFPHRGRTAKITSMSWSSTNGAVGRQVFDKPVIVREGDHLAWKLNEDNTMTVVAVRLKA